MSKKPTQGRWRLLGYTIGLWSLPLSWIWLGVARLPEWNPFVAFIPVLLTLIIYFLCIHRLSRSYPLIRQVWRGWGPIASLMKKRSAELNERDQRIGEQAYQRAYAVLYLASLIITLTFFILFITFPHRHIDIGINIGFLDLIYVALGLVWTISILPITFMAWQLQEDVLPE